MVGMLALHREGNFVKRLAATSMRLLLEGVTLGDQLFLTRRINTFDFTGGLKFFSQ